MQHPLNIFHVYCISTSRRVPLLFMFNIHGIQIHVKYRIDKRFGKITLFGTFHHLFHISQLTSKVVYSLSPLGTSFFVRVCPLTTSYPWHTNQAELSWVAGGLSRTAAGVNTHSPLTITMLFLAPRLWLTDNNLGHWFWGWVNHTSGNRKLYEIVSNIHSHPWSLINNKIIKIT